MNKRTLAAAGFGGVTMHRIQLDDPHTERAHDPPAPIIVPAPIASAQDTTTHGHVGRGQLAGCYQRQRDNPHRLCASLDPWLKAIKLADSNCNRLKTFCATPRGTLKNDQLTATIISSPIKNPNNGEKTIASRIARSPLNCTTDQPRAPRQIRLRRRSRHATNSSASPESA